MKKRNRLLRNALIAVICILIVIAAGYAVLFVNTDVLTLQDGKIKGVKSTWLTGCFGAGGEKHYYKLADVTAPTGFTAVKNAEDRDGDPYTIEYAFARKDTSAGEVQISVYAYPVSEEELTALSLKELELKYISDGKKKNNKVMPVYTVMEACHPDHAGLYLITSPYQEAYIAVKIDCPEDYDTQLLLSDLYAATDKIVPGKQLHPLVADFKLNFLDDNRWLYLVRGLGTTLLITFLSGCMGIVIGAVVAAIRSTWAKNSENMHKGFAKWLLWLGNKVTGVYLTVIRGTPVMVQLLIMYLIIFASAKDGTVAAIMAFGINSGAYVAEIVRGGIMSIDNGQFEAGRSLGFNYLQTMSFIILPQVFKTILPTLANEFIALLKETSVAGYVAVRDLNKGGDIIRSVTYSAFLPLIAVALIYLAIVMFFSWLVSKLERRLRNSDH